MLLRLFNLLFERSNLQVGGVYGGGSRGGSCRLVGWLTHGNGSIRITEC